MFAYQADKPTATEVSRQYEGFLTGHVEVINSETQKFTTLLNFLNSAKIQLEIGFQNGLINRQPRLFVLEISRLLCQSLNHTIHLNNQITRIQLFQ